AAGGAPDGAANFPGRVGVQPEVLRIGELPAVARGACDHRGVVGAQHLRRHVQGDAEAPQAPAQLAVGGHTTPHRQPLQAHPAPPRGGAAGGGGGGGPRRGPGRPPPRPPRPGPPGGAAPWSRYSRAVFPPAKEKSRLRANAWRAVPRPPRTRSPREPGKEKASASPPAASRSSAGPPG